ncbi:ABC-type transport auxiliary lipoprotein family protein [Ramlibacter sp.]|uniref:ABC-type transport auxiliary lipoprotein family protein n=1 Tax=Ramlibacter sp. TaxID=1917967 RepID=UPI002C03B8FC|nr:ABC-type transport auxiliary lipoprotein family protein [Ramlibacter sp.]HWI83742.1 ABC-type transport auxiliary lipoprotein family protein [Ramlibacter sp.]
MKNLLRIALLAAAAALAGCAVAPDKPQRATQYDFGPGPAVALAAAAPAGSQAPIALSDIDANSALDGTPLLYRLGYADDHQVRPYAHARWSAPVPQLIRQRLRERLAQERPVLDLGDSSGLARSRGTLPRTLRLQLEEFSQVFGSPAQSEGLLRLRATLTDNMPAGERLLAQRSVVVRRPAPTPDAAGGVRALAAAVDAASEEIAQWLRQQP